MQVLLHINPPGVPVRFRSRKIYSEVGEYLRNAATGVVSSAPHIRRRKINQRFRVVNAFKVFSRFRNYHIRLMYFFIYIFSAVLVYGNPICRKHIKSVVHCAISLPLLRNDKRLYNVYIAVKFGEELPGVNIPVAVKPRSAQILRQRFKLVDVIRLRFHQRVVVLRLCRNKSVILRVLVRVKKPVNKQSLYPVVAGASRVRRKIGSFRKIIYASNNGFQSVELIL